MSKSKVQASQSIVKANLSQAAQSILVKNLSAQTIKGAIGPDLNSLNVADELTLGLFILDESYSLYDFRQAVIDGYDQNVEALKGSKARDEILLTSWAFNNSSRLLHSYLSLDLIDPLKDYHPDGNTALYKTILDGLTSLIQYEQELKDQGMRVKIDVGVITDGQDNQSQYYQITAADVKSVVSDIRKKRENATFNLVALGNGVDETALADELGFPDPAQFEKTPAGIRRAWGTLSSSVIRTSQTKIKTGGSSNFLAQP